MSDYLAHEGLEHAKKAQEHLESGPPQDALRGVPLAAAILAVLAGLSSLYGNRLAESILVQSKDAIIDQAQASDTWNEYQAESLKAHLAGTAGELAATSSLKKQLAQAERVYRDRQPTLKAHAKQLEGAETKAIDRIERLEAKKLYFDIATAVFQISIVLASISAMTKRPPLFVIAMIGSVIGLVACLIGFVR